MLIPCYTRGKQNTIPTCYLSAGWVSGSLPPQFWDLRSKSLKKLWSHLALLLFLMMTMTTMMMTMSKLFLDHMNQWLSWCIYIWLALKCVAGNLYEGLVTLGVISHLGLPFLHSLWEFFRFWALNDAGRRLSWTPRFRNVGLWGLVNFWEGPWKRVKIGIAVGLENGSPHDLQVVG